MCRHLESMLPGTINGSVSKHTLEGYMRQESLQYLTDDDYEETCVAIERDLVELDLNPTEVSLLMDRFVDGLSLRELANKYGYNNITSILHALDGMKQRLIESGLLIRLKAIKAERNKNG